MRMVVSFKFPACRTPPPPPPRLLEKSLEELLNDCSVNLKSATFAKRGILLNMPQTNLNIINNLLTGSHICGNIDNSLNGRTSTVVVLKSCETSYALQRIGNVQRYLLSSNVFAKIPW